MVSPSAASVYPQGEDYVCYITLAFVCFFGRKDPAITSQQTAVWSFRIKQSKAEPVEVPGRNLSELGF